MKKVNGGFLIALAWLIALLIIIVLISFKESTLSKHEFSEDNLDLFCLENVDFKIKSACIYENKLKIRLENLNEPIIGFNLKRDNNGEILVINDILDKSETKEFVVDINADKIFISGILTIENKDFACNNWKSYDNIKDCGESCNDGTLYGECSDDRHYFCDKGKLINECKTCGCKNGFYCNGFVCSSCKESWLCSGWSECANGKQTRNCTDLNKCKNEFSKPELEQVC